VGAIVWTGVRVMVEVGAPTSVAVEVDVIVDVGVFVGGVVVGV
jgi:hypothetical protein